jgi:adipocyte plasma membrane-associated protein
MYFRFGAIILGSLVVYATLWLMWPSPINAVYWDEPEPPALTGVLAPRPALNDAQLTRLGTAGAASGFIVSDDSTIYYGTATGEVRRRSASGEDVSLADLGDVPVTGIDRIDDTTLGVTTPNGLFDLNLVTGEANRVSAGVPGYPFGFANDLAVAPDGQIYFTDASTLIQRDRHAERHHINMLENRPHGALYVWDPRTHRTRLAADRLYYPNGIAVASDQQSIYIAETFRFRVLRHWIDGPQAGTTDVFANNLPGFPEGLDTDGDGHVFIAMSARRSESLRTIRKNPWLAQIIARLPRWLRPPTSRPTPFIAVLNETSGDVIATLDDTGRHICQISNLTITDNQDLWFGSTDCDYVSQLPQAAVQASLYGPSTRAVVETD